MKTPPAGLFYVLKGKTFYREFSSNWYSSSAVLTILMAPACLKCSICLGLMCEPPVKPITLIPA